MDEVIILGQHSESVKTPAHFGKVFCGDLMSSETPGDHNVCFISPVGSRTPIQSLLLGG